MTTALFLPYYADNPYQDELARGLELHGVEVVTGDHTAPFPILQAVRAHGRLDVIHLHWADSLLVTRSRLVTVLVGLRLLLELAIARLLGVDVVWTVHNRVHHERPMVRLERVFRHLLCWSVTAIIVHGAAARDEIIDTYHLPGHLANRIHVVPHGNYIESYPADISRADARTRLGLPADATVFLHIGNIRPYKNVAGLVETFERLPGDDLRLLIAGRPPADDRAREQLERACATAPRVDATFEFIPADELQIYLRAADAVVLPFTEILTSGSVVLALSFGRPVIAPRRGCIPETVGECDDLLYDPAQPDGLDRALERAIEADLDALGDRAANRAAALDWDAIARRTAAIYDRSTHWVGTESGTPQHPPRQ